MPGQYNPPAFNADNPIYQRELQRRRSKRSMGPSRLARVDEGEVTGRHAGYQLGRHLQYAGLAQSKLASQLAHNRAMAALKHSGRLTGLAESRLKDQRSQLLPSMLLGLGGIAASGYLGHKRDKALKAATERQRLRRLEIDSWIRRQIPGGYGFHVNDEEA